MRLLKRPDSLLWQLLLFLGLPLFGLWGVSALSSYSSALTAATQAYDRTLLASTRTIAERLVVKDGKLQVDVPWVVLDSFELNMNDRLFYKVVDTHGKVISGYDDLPDIPAHTRRTDLYPALAWFYHTSYQNQPIRVASLLQPVNEGGVNGMAKIYVAETLASRRHLASSLLVSSLLMQGILVLLTLLLAWWLLRKVLRPMRQLSTIMVRRDPAVLTPLPDLLPWSETRLLIVAFNRYIERLRSLISRQERFSADASHQLKTPLTVLKTQLSFALASPNPEHWRESLKGMSGTLDSTILLTERLLQLAKIKDKDLSRQRTLERVDLVAIAQECCFSRLAQGRSKQVDLGYEGEPQAWIQGDSILLAEMCANLLDNALKYTPDNGTVTIRIRSEGESVLLEVEDSGPGIDAERRQQALQPFHRLDNAAGRVGAGLGLALVNDIAHWHQTRPELLVGETLGGLLVRVRLKAA